MNANEFERALRAEGYQSIETKSVAPGTHNDTHEHPFDVKALVLDGEIKLTVSGRSNTYRTGDVFTMAAGCKHVENIGAKGVRYVVGRRKAG